MWGARAWAWMLGRVGAPRGTAPSLQELSFPRLPVREAAMQCRLRRVWPVLPAAVLIRLLTLPKGKPWSLKMPIVELLVYFSFRAQPFDDEQLSQRY